MFWRLESNRIDDFLLLLANSIHFHFDPWIPSSQKSYEKPDIEAIKAGTETASNINQRLFYHRIGTPQSDDVLVFFDPENPLFKPAASISDDGKYIFLYIRKDSYPARKMYIGDLEAAGHAIITKDYEWNKLIDDFEGFEY